MFLPVVTLTVGARKSSKTKLFSDVVQLMIGDVGMGAEGRGDKIVI